MVALYFQMERQDKQSSVWHCRKYLFIQGPMTSDSELLFFRVSCWFRERLKRHEIFIHLSLSSAYMFCIFGVALSLCLSECLAAFFLLPFLLSFNTLSSSQKVNYKASIARCCAGTRWPQVIRSTHCSRQ